MADVNKFLTEEFAIKCADEIVEAFEGIACNKNLEVDFHLSKGRMISSTSDPNTWFKFDTNEGSYPSLKKMIDALEGKSVSDYSGESLEGNAMSAFESLIGDKLNEHDRMDRIRKVIRKITFRDVPEELLPMTDIVCSAVELTGGVADQYLLKLNKTAVYDPNSDSFVGSSGAAAKLMQEHISTGRDVQDILREKHDAEDPDFAMVKSAEWTKYIYEVAVGIASDYSFNPEYTPSGSA